MTHTIIHKRVDEWEEEICDDCGHSVSSHYDQPLEVMSYETGKYQYTAIGCMILDSGVLSGGGRQLPGNNPFLRCKCLHSK